MLRDSVCDEATNNELCLYDGGDCCLEAKITTNCNSCACILAVYPPKLRRQLKEMNVARFKSHVDVNTVVGDWSLMIEEVISDQVCAVLCMDNEMANQINTWHYNTKTRKCWCGWTESTKCPETLVIASIDHSGIEQTFVQLKKTITCGNYTWFEMLSLCYSCLHFQFRMFCCGSADQQHKDKQRPT